MKYNRREIMKNAWFKVRRFNMTMKDAMRIAWYEAKKAAQRFNVYGESFYMDTPVLIASGVSFDRAGEIEWQNKCRFANIIIKAA
jgi:hypothetical protein